MTRANLHKNQYQIEWEISWGALDLGLFFYNSDEKERRGSSRSSKRRRKGRRKGEGGGCQEVRIRGGEEGERCVEEESGGKCG